MRTLTQEGARPRLLHSSDAEDHISHLCEYNEVDGKPRQDGALPLRTVGAVSRERCIGAVDALAKITLNINQVRLR